MKIIKPSYEILTPINGNELELMEFAARVCYKSEYLISDVIENRKAFIRGLIKNGHDAMLEHSILSVKFIVDRGVTHELVRHRLSSFAQESTRYCNYSNERLGHELVFILPHYLDTDYKYAQWYSAMSNAEKTYFDMLKVGCKPEEARSVLPVSIKSEIVVTTNYREWRHILKLRAAGTTGKPHPQMVEVMVPLLKELKEKIPAIFDDIEV